MGRKILFITTDQQRYDTLGCNGGTIARTPVVDALAAEGVRYDRAHPQSVVCMPSRSTMLTGQHVSTHGVWMNGVPLPEDAPSVAEVLHDAGYRTAIIGKPHFEPFLDPFARFAENGFARNGTFGPHRGFEHFESATHGAAGPLHYARWLASTHPEAVGMFYPVLDGLLEVNAMGGGDTGAPQAWRNEIPREWYHTDWVADRTIAWLDSLPAGDDWFCWMSFPDPHHPWDPPASEIGRIDWHDVPLPARLHRRRHRTRSVCSTANRATTRLVRGHARQQLRGAARLGTEDDDSRSGARDHRAQRGGGRVDRRGDRPRARRDPPAGGTTTSTSCSPPTTANSAATSG
ncbi:MAG: sulfatase-like hydrolase/transferase [Ilumatobacteraceae bacterium]